MNLNNQVLHLANQGVTINEIHNEYQVPPSLQRQWNVRQYHGSEFHNSRAVINRYLGYWDGNPATLVPLSPQDSAPLFVEMMGGAGAIMERAQLLFDLGQYRLAMEILNKLIYAEPLNQQGKDLLAAVFEQLGYQYESASMRNVFLASAQELRNGAVPGANRRGAGPSQARAMTISQWWDAIGTRVDSSQADGLEFTINLSTPDTNENFVIEMSGATLSNIEGFSSTDADVSVNMNRSYLELYLIHI